MIRLTVVLVALCAFSTASSADAHRAARKKLMAEMLGAERGSPGRLFDEVVIGKLPPKAIDKRLADVGYAMDTSELEQRLLVWVKDPLSAPTACDDLREAMAAKWGPPEEADPYYFLNPKTGRRAWLMSCELRFDRFQPIDQFIKRAVALLGQPSTRTSWTELPIGVSVGSTNVSVKTANGRVVRVTAELPDPSVVPDVRDALEKRFGKYSPRFSLSEVDDTHVLTLTK